MIYIHTVSPVTVTITVIIVVTATATAVFLTYCNYLCHPFVGKFNKSNIVLFLIIIIIKFFFFYLMDNIFD